MFTQKISMDCTKEQYEKYLKDELLKMGYKECSINCWDDNKFHYICNNYNGDLGDLGTIREDSIENYDRTYLGSFNAPSFLALAAMTDKAEGNYGEYWTCISNNRYFTEGDIYKCIGFYSDKSPKFYDIEDEENGAKIKQLFKHFRKATKEEIMAKFGEKAISEKIEYPIDVTCNTDEENYFYATEKQMISLLKSKGYKILKPKTWEEV